MCGRYVIAKSTPSLAHYFRALPDPEDLSLHEQYNLSPTDPAPIVIEHNARRHLMLGKWGLIPPWSPTGKMTYPTFNARIETVEEKPTFTTAFKKNHALVPFEGYYEWPRKGRPCIYTTLIVLGF